MSLPPPRRPLPTKKASAPPPRGTSRPPAPAPAEQPKTNKTKAKKTEVKKGKAEKPKARKTKAPKAARPATDNKVPRVKKIASKHFSEDAIKLGVLIRGLDAITIGRYDRLELRRVPERLQVILNEDLGVNCRACYSIPAETEKILKYLKKQIPSEFWPAKWVRTFEEQ